MVVVDPAICWKTSSGNVPPKLVGASTVVHGSKMYLFGGRLVLSDRLVSTLYVCDLETMSWRALPQQDRTPEARCFHTAHIWNNQLVVFGGIGDSLHGSRVFNDVRMLDLTSHRWLPWSRPSDDFREFTPRGRYAHLASVSEDCLFVIGGQDLEDNSFGAIHVFDLYARNWVQKRSFIGCCGSYQGVAVSATPIVKASRPGPTSKVDLEGQLAGVHIFSHRVDDKPHIDVLVPSSNTEISVSALSCPGTPNLHFPSGGIIGSHLVLAGFGEGQSFSVYALDMSTLAWTHVELGESLSEGSWARGCLWEEGNKLVVFGDRHANAAESFQGGILEWDHVAVIDLEAFGVYQTPLNVLSSRAQENGLGALRDSAGADFDIICDDGRSINCSRQKLEESWPWFREQRRKFQRAAQSSFDSPVTHYGTPVPIHTAGPDSRLTARTFDLSEPYAITTALLQYFYSMALSTPVQLAPVVLSRLLVIANVYQIEHLESLVKHAMHCALSEETAVGVYEVATACGCSSLRIRAMKMIAAQEQAKKSAHVKAPTPGGRYRRPPPIVLGTKPSRTLQSDTAVESPRPTHERVTTSTGQEMQAIMDLLSPRIAVTEEQIEVVNSMYSARLRASSSVSSKPSTVWTRYGSVTDSGSTAHTVDVDSDEEFGVHDIHDETRGSWKGSELARSPELSPPLLGASPYGPSAFTYAPSTPQPHQSYFSSRQSLSPSVKSGTRTPPRSPGRPDSFTIMSPKSPSAFARFVGRSALKSPTSVDTRSVSDSSSRSTIQAWSSDSKLDSKMSKLDLKMSKADEKQRKKVEAKARIERLAKELREKEDLRKTPEAKAARARNEAGIRTGRWEERNVTVFGGFTSSL